MSKRLAVCTLSVLALLFAVAPAAHARRDGWEPINPADLAMKAHPKRPGAHAMILYREVEENDINSTEAEYVRIKIFTDAGKDFANIETRPYDARHFAVTNISGRTIHPDGTIVPFSGKTFQKTAVKTKNATLAVTAFTLPDVTAGSIIEYKYTIYWEKDWVYDTRWTLDAPLDQREAHFIFIPAKDFAFSYVTYKTPDNAQPKKLDDTYGKRVLLDLQNVPAYEEEPYSQHEDYLRSWVRFYYSETNPPPQADAFWKSAGKKWAQKADSFIGKLRPEAVADIISPSDTSDTKLRKIYAKVQSIRNLTYEKSHTEQEIKRDKLFDNKNAGDVLRNNFGWHNELNRTFVALARAAGFDATVVLVSERDESAFFKAVLSMRQFQSEIAVVRDAGTEIYLDPGRRFCPYGFIGWEDSATTGMRLDKSNFAFTMMPPPLANQASTTRQAKFALATDGTLEGTFDMIFAGQNAMEMRFQVSDQDEAGRKKYMEDMVKQWFTAAATVELEKADNWTASTDKLVLSFKVSIPSYASPLGRTRLFLPATVFAGAHRNPFVRTYRASPVVFRFPITSIDDVTITLPDGASAQSQPFPRTIKNNLAEFNKSWTKENDKTLHFKREYRAQAGLLAVEHYPGLRQFFEAMKAADGEQIMLNLPEAAD